MVRGSYVKGTSFVGVNSSESEDVVIKDVKERLTCPHLGTLSTERPTCPLPRNTEYVTSQKYQGSLRVTNETARGPGRCEKRVANATNSANSLSHFVR